MARRLRNRIRERCAEVLRPIQFEQYHAASRAVGPAREQPRASELGDERVRQVEHQREAQQDQQGGERQIDAHPRARV